MLVVRTRQCGSPHLRKAAGAGRGRWGGTSGCKLRVWLRGRILKGVVGLRISTAVSWMTRAFVWTLVGGAMPVWIVPPAAVLVPIHSCLRESQALKTFFRNLLRVVSGQWGH